MANNTDTRTQVPFREEFAGILTGLEANVSFEDPPQGDEVHCRVVENIMQVEVGRVPAKEMLRQAAEKTLAQMQEHNTLHFNLDVWVLEMRCHFLYRYRVVYW